jgi:hypothetical protein
MLGRLDEDLSCANSRLFRATLYANAKISALLRDNFVLYWSSERPVPKVTIDFGDGRRLERTTTGNSAHYVLDESGRVLDVLPGLYSAPGFVAELTKSLELARRVRGMSDAERAAAIAAYHGQLASHAIPNSNVGSELALAQNVTFGKRAMERPDLSRYVPEAQPMAVRRVSERWFEIGRPLYRGELFDAMSRALVVRLHTGDGRLATSPDELVEMLARFEHNIIADTGLNQTSLRPQIAQHILEAGGAIEFDELNSWIYAQVFHTPKSDAWLGLLPRTDFTGISADGVVMP